MHRRNGATENERRRPRIDKRIEDRLTHISIVLALVIASASGARAQTAAKKFEILDNSFLVEEAFNQEAGVVQTIGTWSIARRGDWEAMVTQEWPIGGKTHQFSFTVPFAGAQEGAGIGDVLVNYRFQLMDEDGRRPAIAPRVSLVLPTSRDRFESRIPGVQTNVPFSKQFGDLYVHWNAGLTWLPGIDLTAPQLAASTIWRVAPMFNLMLEAVLEEATLTVSPGFRRGWNIGDHQIVFGAALPVSGDSDGPRLAFLSYLSYELPFK